MTTSRSGTTANHKERVCRSIHAMSSRLVGLSHRIHAHPELAFEEERASHWTAELLADAGFSIEAGLCNLPTAFAARAGSGPLSAVFCAEYDALPGIGHACGHNMIAAMAAGAGIGLTSLLDELGISVTVLGTPAEEIGNGGGKILLLERGALTGTHLAMMLHPGPHDSMAGGYLAASTQKIEYFGRASHASACPQLGINAADALTVAQTSIALLRQHIRPTDRIHGIVTHGGDVPNVIPAYTSASYTLRARSLEELGSLTSRVRSCFMAGAVATGCRLRVTGGDKPYAEMHQDRDLMRAYRNNAESLGRRSLGSNEDIPSGASTDMGNISRVLPCIHPTIGIDSFPVVNHQPEFAAHCISPTADNAVIVGAQLMAQTLVDVALDDVLRRRFLTEPPKQSADTLY